MKTKYVCRGLISLYVNFRNNRTMWSTNLHVKIGRWGNGKRAQTAILNGKTKQDCSYQGEALNVLTAF